MAYFKENLLKRHLKVVIFKGFFFFSIKHLTDHIILFHGSPLLEFLRVEHAKLFTTGAMHCKMKERTQQGTKPQLQGSQSRIKVP